MARGSWYLLAALILGLALPVVAQQPQAPPPILIVPGQSIAGVTLGRSAPATLARLGQPMETRTLRDGMLYTYPRYGLNVYVTDGVVRAVSTTNSLLRTAEGIALGSTVADVRRVFGSQFSDAVVEGLMGIAYDQHGIAFGLDGVVVSVIIVYPPRTQAAPPSAAPAQAPATQTAPVQAAPVQPAAPANTVVTQVDLGLVVMPRVENLKPFSPETQYMSVVGFLRYVVYQQTGHWLTHTEATRMLQEQQRMRL
ncbi:MAG: hypothetical protein HY355_07040 [Armatimonadetes bacterium]|nr:hypothetical protein [Armatimonadota bacterium]